LSRKQIFHGNAEELGFLSKYIEGIGMILDLRFRDMAVMCRRRSF
jgi:hypothetical protein